MKPAKLNRFSKRTNPNKRRIVVKDKISLCIWCDKKIVKHEGMVCSFCINNIGKK